MKPGLFIKLNILLKLMRKITAVIVILIISLSFFDIYSFITPETVRYISLTQFIPSMLSFMSTPSLIFCGFIIVLVLTITAGRSYCSFLCPLGIFQDIISRISSVLKIKKFSGYTSPNNFIRYTILIITSVYYSTAGTLLLIWLDPFSIYGRFASAILSPGITGINNTAAVILSKFNIYSIHSVNVKYADAALMIVIISMIMSISVLAVFKGRFYCNTICPIGSLLGLLSKISFFKIQIDKERCIHCGKCEKTCKSSCINHSEEHVDFSRCVSCFNCLTVCPNSSINFRFTYNGRVKNFNEESDRTELKSYRENVKIGRKSFLSGMMFLPSIISSQTVEKKQQLFIQDRSKQKEYKKNIFSSPPGSSGIEKFNEKCTACSLCITRCPSSVLQPAVLQYGVYGIMQPFLDFNTGYCNYDCTICSEVCPTGAIRKINVAEKHLTQTGKSIFIKENCITYTNGTACGACSEHCPTKAVDMIPFRDDLVIPEVNQKICIGCGACEYVCPVRPLKAIYVDGNSIHEKAELPKKEKKRVVEKEDFPF